MYITQRDVRRFPCFFNHSSARMWFKEKYGSFFVLYGTDDVTRDKVYYYHLVRDKERYLEWRDLKAKLEPVDDNIYIDTYQTIEITESGKINSRHENELQEITI